MQRRTLLSTLGIGLTAALAGCTASANGGDDPTETPTETASPTPEPIEAVLVEPGEQLTAVVGANAIIADGLGDPHHVRLRNDIDAPWFVSIDVSPPLVSGHAETYEVRPEAEVVLTFPVPAEYDVSVTDVQSTATTTATITPSNFDCNQSSTVISPDGGELSVQTLSTRMACAPPTITEETPFSVTLGDGSLPDDEATKPQSVMVSNATDTAETVEFSISTTDEQIVFGGTYRLEPNARLEVSLTEVRGVVAAVTRADGETTESVSISESQFDCNSSTTVLALVEDEIQARTRSTLLFCGEE
ncbi:hypothetical protein ACFQJC_08065 [Haloferax namakaokahaiae]|uniref:META domain-containing protein n=1 Tax=Haloferax namakaokahaiae TaxID=1748331 RepID=A0ABD5ZED4_9EURY